MKILETNIKRTVSGNPDFIQLVKELDIELAITDGEDHAFYDQFNKLDNIKYVVVLYEERTPVACGAIKEYAPGIMEIKRMYVRKNSRGRGYASKILKELEKWTAELACNRCILETGINQPEAIALYRKNSYTIISNYGQYEGVEKSFCFGKSV